MYSYYIVDGSTGEILTLAINTLFSNPFKFLKHWLNCNSYFSSNYEYFKILVNDKTNEYHAIFSYNNDEITKHFIACPMK